MLRALSFSAGFYDLKVVFIGETGLSLFSIFALLFTPIILLNRFFSNSRNNLNKSHIYLLFFILYLVVSKIFPFYAGSVMVLPYTSNYLDLTYQPLPEEIFGIRNLFFPILYVLTAIAISIKVQTYLQFLNCVSSFIWGVLVIGVTGIFFQILAISNSEMSANLIALFTFGNSFTDEILARIDYQSFAGLKRMYSFAGEPGYGANLFIFALGILLVTKDTNIKKSSFLYNSKIPTLALLIMSIMTLSTTGILGILITIFVIILWASQNKIRSLLLIIIFLGLALLILIIFDDLRIYFIENHLLKLIGGAGSGAIRFINLQHSVELFFINPIFGIGYGSHRSTTFILSLLVNLGLVGTTIFFLMILDLIFKKRDISFKKGISKGLSTALLVWIILSPISQTGVALLFPWLWLAIGLLISYPSKYKILHTLK